MRYYDNCPDPLTNKIRESADVIGFICANTASFESGDFSVRQLEKQLSRIRDEADAILKATGVCDLERHHKEMWERLRMDALGSEDWLKPYVGVEAGDIR